MDKRTLFFIVSLTLALFFVRMGFDYYNDESRKEWQATQNKRIEAQDAAKLEETKAEESSQGAFAVATKSNKQEYYILENDYLQLVFSNIGGSVVEINLPFRTKNDPNSVVLPIEIDREMVQKSPQNARFPLHVAKDYMGQPKGGKENGKLGGYYPLLRRDQLGPQDAVTFAVPPKFYCLNIVSEYPEVAELEYEVKNFSRTEIIFEATQPHRRITKKFTLPTEDVPYAFTLDLKVEGANRGLWLTSGVPEIEWLSGASGSTVKYRITKNKGYEVLQVDLPSQAYTNSTSSPDWVCNSNGFFGLILDPQKIHETGFRVDKIQGTEDPSRLQLIDPDFARYAKDQMPGYNVLLPLKAQPQSLEVRLFTGPFADSVLNQVDSYYAKTSGSTSDYIACQTYFGFFSYISEPFAKFLFFLMKFCYSITGSWVLSILFVTIILRVILYPLNTWSIRSMKSMQEVGPEIKALQEKYKKDPQRAQLEIIKLYREKGVNPVSGCLPMILQLPFLVGMFDLLKTTFELRGAVFIPGWIDNLTAPDVLFTWGPHIPFIGNEFHLLPIILGGIMYVQQNVMSSLPKDPSTWTEQQRQQRTMGNVMTVVMTVLFYNFPSGLNIYWIFSMLLGILQQWWTTREMDKGPKKATVEIVVEPTTAKRKKLT